MEILIIFAVLVGLVIIANIFIWFAELIENTKLGSRYGDEVATLSARLESACVQEMRMDFDSLRVRTCERMGRLIGPDAKVPQSMSALSWTGACSGLLPRNRFILYMPKLLWVQERRADR